MTNPCDGCIENTERRFCITKHDDTDPKDCPCGNCIVKSMCNRACKEYANISMTKKGD